MGDKRNATQTDIKNYVQLETDTEKQFQMLNVVTTDMTGAARFHLAKTPADTLIAEVLDAASKKPSYKYGVVYPLRTATRDVYFASAEQHTVGGLVHGGPAGYRAPLTMLECSLSDAVGVDGKVLKCKDDRGYRAWQNCDGTTISLGEPHSEQGDATTEDTSSKTGKQEEAKINLKGCKIVTLLVEPVDATSEASSSKHKPMKRRLL